MYDLVIAYRIYPGISKEPFIFQNDKYKFAELCLASLKDALENYKVKIFIISDGCPMEYELLFEKYLGNFSTEIIKTDKIGNAQTFKMQLDLLSKQNYSENIFFCEDDYFFLPHCFEEMLYLINLQNIDFVTPFDHPDRYSQPFHNYKSEVMLGKNIHWQTTASTTMTFLTKKSTLAKSYSIFNSYVKNNYDISLWWSLTKKRIFEPSRIFKLLRKDKMFLKIYAKLIIFTVVQVFFKKKYKLWSPIPSLACHLDNSTIAPNIDWMQHISEIIKKYKI